MTDADFWAIIDSAGPYTYKDQDRYLGSVRNQLLAQPPEQIREFYALFCRRMVDAQSWDMWGAAYLINGGCSDDGFVYFRAWLIAQGRAVYEAAVANPDSLARVVEFDGDDHEFEWLYALPQVVYEELTGRPMPNIDVDWPLKPRGVDWDFDDDAEVCRRLPQLAAMCPP
jgi:hypothetical protein